MILKLFLSLVSYSFLSFTSLNDNLNCHSILSVADRSTSETLYHSLELAGHEMDFFVFDQAYHGYTLLKEKGKLTNTGLITIVDFSKASSQKRLWVIDLEKQKLIYHTLVAHGKNSGENFATQFSNTIDSYQSSLGFYVTGKPYIGKHGLSLVLEGVEHGFNDNARDRAIVMHGANYVNERFVRTYGRLGRSHGCPAIPQELAEPIIKTVAEGSCLFIFYADEDYLESSGFLKKTGHSG